MQTFRLRVTLTDGFTFDLRETYQTATAACRAARNYISDYSDPCGLGVRVSYITTLIAEARS